MDISTFCPNRWTVRGDASANIIENYEVFKELWDETLVAKLEPDIKDRIIGVMLKINVIVLAGA